MAGQKPANGSWARPLAPSLTDDKDKHSKRLRTAVAGQIKLKKEGPKTGGYTK